MNQCNRLLFLVLIVMLQINLTSVFNMKILPARIFFSAIVVGCLLQSSRLRQFANNLSFFQRELCLWLLFLGVLLTAPVLLPTQAFAASIMYLLINPSIWLRLDQKLQVRQRIKTWGTPPLVICDDSETTLKIIVQIADRHMLQEVTKHFYKVLGALSDQDLQGSTLVVDGDKEFEPHFRNILSLRLKV